MIMIIITIIIPSPPHDESLCSLTFREKKIFRKKQQKAFRPSPCDAQPKSRKGQRNRPPGTISSSCKRPQWLHRWAQKLHWYKHPSDKTHGFWAHSQVHIWGFPKMVVPNNHGFSYWKWSFWGVLGVPPFRKHPYKYVGGPSCSGKYFEPSNLCNGRFYEFHLMNQTIHATNDIFTWCMNVRCLW